MSAARPCLATRRFARALPGLLEERVRTAEYQRSFGQFKSRFLRDQASPNLRFIVWMATRRCNLKCRYCVLPHEESPGADLGTEEVKRVFSEIAEDFDPSRIMVGITGGEATTRPDLVEIVRHMVELRFRTVAVDSNGVQYGRKPELMDRLVDAGMRCPTISADGVGEGQRRLRGDRSGGAWTWKAIEYVQKRYPKLGLTTICAASPLNLAEVPEVFKRFEDLGVAFSRISPIFPVGRASEDPEVVLSPRQLVTTLEWVAEQRAAFAAGRRDIEIEFIDDGWCGKAWEGGMLRSNFLYCRAGVTVLGLEHDGRVVGCPVIHSAFNTQGDARTQRVSEVWKSRFQPFRDRGWLRQGTCASCAEWDGCLGGSMHNRGDDGELQRCTAQLIAACYDDADRGGSR